MRRAVVRRAVERWAARSGPVWRAISPVTFGTLVEPWCLVAIAAIDPIVRLPLVRRIGIAAVDIVSRGAGTVCTRAAGPARSRAISTAAPSAGPGWGGAIPRSFARSPANRFVTACVMVGTSGIGPNPAERRSRTGRPAEAAGRPAALERPARRRPAPTWTE
jgi:hypothetical protein